MAKVKRTKQEIEKEMWDARYNKYKRLVAVYSECPYECGHPVMTWEEANEIYKQTKIRPSYCNGEQYLQENAFASQIRGDTSLYLLCDGENHNNARDLWRRRSNEDV